MSSPSPVTDQSSALADLLCEWIDYPLLLAERGTIVAANARACDLCGRSNSSLSGINLAAAIDLLYEGVEEELGSLTGEAEVQVYRLNVEGRAYQAAVLRLPKIITADERNLRGLLQKGFDAYFIASATGKLLDFSDSYARLTGYAAADLRNMNIGEVDRDQAGVQIASHWENLKRQGFDQFEVRQRVRGSSEFRDLEIRLSSIPKTGGHCLGYVRDVTAKNSADAELKRSVQLLRTVEDALRLAQRVADRAELMHGICRGLVENAGYGMAWVGIRDPEGGPLIRVEASYGGHLELLDVIEIEVEDTLLARKEAGIGDERTAVYDDFAAADLADWKERAVQCGFGSSLSLPIRSEGRVEAVLNILAEDRDSFGDQAVRALAHVAEAAELGLQIQRKRSLQKAVEQNAQDWDESFRAAFEHSLYGMLVYDLGGKILDANAELCTRLGYTRQELIGMYLDQIVAPRDASSLSEHLEAIRAGGFAVFETEHVARDGSVHKVEISCRTYVYGEDQIVLAISRDIAQPVQTTAADAALRLALEASQTGLFDWDLATNKVVFSPEWKAQLGYKDEEISDDFAEWELRVHPDDVQAMVAGLKAYLERPRTGYEAEYRMRHKNGTYLWMLVRGAVIVGDNGVSKRMLGSHVDITSRKRIHQRIEQSRKLDSVGRLAGGVAHDISRLMTIVNGYSDLVLPDLYEGDPLKNRVQAIRDAGERASSLADQLMGISQRRPVSPRTVNLNAIVADMQETLQRLIGDGIRLRSELSPEMPYVFADPGQLRQLLLNLVVNARDAMPGGGDVTLGVSLVDGLPANLAELGLAPSRQVRLFVSDTGTGMDESTQLQIFDPYFTTKEGGDRKGLGLSTVFGIVKQHGGAIAVNSDVGKGTIFDVYFPAAAPDYREQSPVAEELPAEHGGGGILLVEPDAALRQLIREVLVSAGYRVFEAANGGDALLLCEKERDRIDAVITDSDLALISGTALIERIRLIVPGVQAVVTSPKDPKSNPGVRSHDLHLSKPFAPEALLRAVSSVLRERPELQ